MMPLISVTPLIGEALQGTPRMIGVAHIISVQFTDDTTTILIPGETHPEPVRCNGNLQDLFEQYADDFTNLAPRY